MEPLSGSNVEALEFKRIAEGVAPALGQRCRKWIFTINNYTDEDLELLGGLEEFADYMVYGFEKGEKGTPHIQGYVRLKDGKTMSAMNKYCPRAWLHKAYGDDMQNRKYCMKQGNAEELGVPKEDAKGRRTDIAEVCEAVSNGANMWEISNEYGYQAMKHAEALFRYKKPELVESRLIVWKEGEDALEEQIATYGSGFFIVDKNKWDGYDGEPIVIWDADELDAPSAHWQKKFKSGVPLRVRGLYSIRPLEATVLIICSRKPDPMQALDDQLRGVAKRCAKKEALKSKKFDRSSDDEGDHSNL